MRQTSGLYCRCPRKQARNCRRAGRWQFKERSTAIRFQTVLEPDGSLGHWMRVNVKLRRAAGVSSGDIASSKWKHAMTGRSRTCHRILRQLRQLPLRRSKTYGKRSRRWRAGNGFAGSMQLTVLTPANDELRSVSRKWPARNGGRAVSNLPRAPTRTSQRTAGFSSRHQLSCPNR